MSDFDTEAFSAVIAPERRTVALVVPPPLIDGSAAPGLGEPLPALARLVAGGVPSSSRAGQRARRWPR
jgi:hypothetical protein